MSFGTARFKLTLVLCLVIGQVFNILPAQAGTSSGGGGSTIRFKGQTRPFLLDRLSLNPGLFSNLNQSLALDHSVKLPALDSGKALAVLNREDIGEALKLADDKLTSWSTEYKKQVLTNQTAIYLGMIELIRESLGQMTFLRTSLDFNLLDRYDLEASLKSLNPEIQMVILYLPKYGSIISEAHWNELDLETQAGLLIHESIRQIQGLYMYYDLSDYNLQSITAKIMDLAPSTVVAFDSNLIGSTRFARRCFVNGYGQPGILNQDINAGDLQIAKMVLDLNSSLDIMLSENQLVRAKIISDQTTLQFLVELKSAGILKNK